MFKKSESGLAPVLKWVGGKRQLLKAFEPLFPSEIEYYCEPFVGGGAVFLHLRPKRAMISDINAEIINLYQVIRDDVDGLITKVSEFTNDKDCYYAVREWDKYPEYQSMSAVDRAARILYLNRTCFNGVYRVNKSGYFNVPFGRYKNPMILDEENLHALNQYFNEADITFKVADCVTVLDEVPDNAFVYLDPPYDPVSVTASFTSYAKDGFSKEDQHRLRECCDRLNARGVKFMLSNSATDFIKSEYQNYRIDVVKANRSINRDGDGRGAVDEVVVRNYETEVVPVMEEAYVGIGLDEEEVKPVRRGNSRYDKDNPRHAINVGIPEDVYQACMERFRAKGISLSGGVAEVLAQYVNSEQVACDTSDVDNADNTTTIQEPEDMVVEEVGFEPKENMYESILLDIKDVLDSARNIGLPMSIENAMHLVLAMRQ